MKNRLKTLALGIVTALLPTLLSANDVATKSLHERLTLDEGMNLAGDGLYAQESDAGISYVATNDAGRRALATKIRALLPSIRKQLAGSGLNHQERKSLSRSEALIGELESAIGKGAQTGGCESGATVYARALSSWGTQASGLAKVTLDFGPTTPTNNYAEAETDFTYITDSGVGSDPAEAIAAEPFSCVASAQASVFCPGTNTAAVHAWAFSVSRTPRCRQ